MSRFINYTAVRSFNKVFAPRSHELCMAADADAKFDGGEFSASFHAEQYESEELRIASEVGAHFGLSGEELYEMVMRYEHEQSNIFFNVVCASPAEEYR